MWVVWWLWQFCAVVGALSLLSSGFIIVAIVLAYRAERRECERRALRVVPKRTPSGQAT